MTEFVFSAENEIKFEKLLEHYPENEKQAAAMGALWLAQEQEGYVSEEAVRKIAVLLKVPMTRIYELASFYEAYRSEPVGKYHVEFCRGLCCGLRKIESVKQACLSFLNIKAGQTSPDGLFSVTEVNCLGACVKAPVMRVNGIYHELLTPESAVEILKKYASEDS